MAFKCVHKYMGRRYVSSSSTLAFGVLISCLRVTCAYPTIVRVYIIILYSIVWVYFLSTVHTVYIICTYICVRCVYSLHTHTYSVVFIHTLVCMYKHKFRDTRLTTCMSTTTDDRLHAFILIFSRFVSPRVWKYVRRYSCVL